MKTNVLINQIRNICKNHNVDINDTTIKFDGMDFDMVPEYDSNTKEFIYHHKGYLKEKFVND